MIVVAAAVMTTAPVTVEARTTARAAMAMVMIDLVALAISHFITHHILATAFGRVVPIAIAFVSVQ